jgi:hypothetical protein
MATRGFAQTLYYFIEFSGTLKIWIYRIYTTKVHSCSRSHLSYGARAFHEANTRAALSSTVRELVYTRLLVVRLARGLKLCCIKQCHLYPSSSRYVLNLLYLTVHLHCKYAPKDIFGCIYYVQMRMPSRRRNRRRNTHHDLMSLPTLRFWATVTVYNLPARCVPSSLPNALLQAKHHLAQIAMFRCAC